MTAIASGWAATRTLSAKGRNRGSCIWRADIHRGPRSEPSAAAATAKGMLNCMSIWVSGSRTPLNQSSAARGNVSTSTAVASSPRCPLSATALWKRSTDSCAKRPHEYGL